MGRAIEIGRQAAYAAADRLSRFSVSAEEYAAWRETQRRPAVVLPIVDRIEIENNSLISDRTIRASLRVREGEPLDVQQLGEDLGRLYGLDAFERVQFDLHPEGDQMVLFYRLDARERGTNYFRLGLNLETIFGDESNFNVAANHVWYPANAWGGELRTQAQFGDTSGVSTGFYQPIDPREWFFLLPQVEFEATHQDVYVNDRRVARYDLEAVTPQLLLGANISNVAQIRAGIAYTDGQATRSIGDSTVFQSANFSGGAWTAAFELDTLDDTRFPTDGEYVLVETLLFREELGFEQNVTELRTQGSIYRSFRGYTLGLAARYDTSFDSTSRVDLLSSLGGFFNLSGFPTDSIVGRHVGLLSVRAYKSIATPSIFAWEFPIYLGGIFETGNAWSDRDDYDNLLWSVSPFVGAGTPLGPLYVAYAYGEGGEHQGYLYLGMPF
jgi:NTE family protein